ncbi:DUF1456 family protein [Thalassotalea aquiviva]|uniref:DUF1456 family protein n=1 Tax=Thalassotalea aquiviva TaxID=3242415 RepID=UPI00352B3239
MTNNQILRRIRYIFDYNDAKMMAIFASADYPVQLEQLHHWLRKDDDPKYVNLTDQQLAYFLNGFINEKRGKKDGPAPVAEKKLNNNIILRKLKIALNLTDVGMIELIELANLRIGKSELSAFFRKPDHKHFRECKDQFIRNFLAGMQVKYRDNDPYFKPQEKA